MIHWSKYRGHEPDIQGKRKKFDNNIYVLDIETSSYLILGNKIIPAIDYIKLTEEEQKQCIKQSTMYLWQLSINDNVYYGREWKELKNFIKKIDDLIPDRKVLFIHNLSFEFQYIKNIFSFEEVTARKSRKPMTALMKDFNFLCKCTYFMSNCKLEKLPELFKLPIEKKVGDLDYDLIRHSKTPLTDEELEYGNNDCLVVYYYILEELKTYEYVTKIPTTSTGHVRRELMELVMTDYAYKRKVGKSINTDPHIYNLLCQAFMGGYTHSNWIYTDEILYNVDSYDITSSYPFILTAFKFPSSEFRKCNIKDHKLMSKKLNYLLVVKFTNIKCKYYNNFISFSKCRNIRGGKYDNGRVIEARELEITLTDVDFYFILDTYNCNYEILEIYWATSNYLPKQFINFVLDKYVNKTKYKDDPEHELEYQKEKNKFNALFGMSVTNTIRDDVIYNDDSKLWEEKELTNDEIINKLVNEKKKSFLSFAYGVWVTAYARDNLLRRVIELDEHVIYCDTDSIKLTDGYNKDVFINYNEQVKKRIEFVSNNLEIPIERYSPTDIHDVSHMLGLFECETKGGGYTYDEFITQGAKKYAFKKDGKINITVSGVPKKTGSKALKDLKDFKDDYIFEYDMTHKLLMFYCENQIPVELTDYLGNKYKVNDKSGCCLVPTTYKLSKSLEYATLLNDASSKRAIYKEDL